MCIVLMYITVTDVVLILVTKLMKDAITIDMYEEVKTQTEWKKESRRVADG